jgi:hypothetical protein
MTGQFHHDIRGKNSASLVAHVLDDAMVLRVSPARVSFRVFKLIKLPKPQFMFGSLRAVCKPRGSNKKARTQSCCATHGSFGPGDSTNILEVFDALDNFCSADGSVAPGNGFVLHPGRLHSHSADFGHRNGVDPHYSGAESGIANVQSQNFLRSF